MTSSERDYKAMIHLFEQGDFTWSLFIGHLVVEKLLKACFVRKISPIPPYIHDLVRLAEKSDLSLSEEQKDILDTLSTFNIQARYDDYKMDFFKRCTRDYARQWIINIEEFTKWLKSKHLSES